LNAEDHPAERVARREFSRAPRDDHPRSVAEILGGDPALAHFDGLYANRLKARAACVEQTKIDNGEEISAKCEARDEAARQLLVAPAPYPDHVWWKWEALEYLASADAIEGEHVHNPVVAALGLVKADLIRLGNGNIVRDE
jgi:hypothetical protein